MTNQKIETTTVSASTEARERMRIEAKRIRGAALWAAEVQYAAETSQYRLTSWFGIPSVVFSALAGATALAKFPGQYIPYVIAGISTAAAIMSALLTFLDPKRHAATYHASAKSYEVLFHDAGYFYRIHALSEGRSEAELEEKLAKLLSRFNDLNGAALAVPTKAYATAADNLKRGFGEVVRDVSDVLDADEVAPSRQ